MYFYIFVYISGETGLAWKCSDSAPPEPINKGHLATKFGFAYITTWERRPSGDAMAKTSTTSPPPPAAGPPLRPKHLRHGKEEYRPGKISNPFVRHSVHQMLDHSDAYKGILLSQ